MLDYENAQEFHPLNMGLSLHHVDILYSYPRCLQTTQMVMEVALAMLSCHHAQISRYNLVGHEALYSIAYRPNQMTHNLTSEYTQYTAAMDLLHYA